MKNDDLFYSARYSAHSAMRCVERRVLSAPEPGLTEKSLARRGLIECPTCSDPKVSLLSMLNCKTCKNTGSIKKA